ncbi:hypothetical protein N7486_001257 [Penicillium sp. IBT 16267x]|nr:hypothetical protein N7486_001257 [Penicillium sp. IBT 16267x]
MTWLAVDHRGVGTRKKKCTLYGIFGWIWGESGMTYTKVSISGSLDDSGEESRVYSAAFTDLYNGRGVQAFENNVRF